MAIKSLRWKQQCFHSLMLKNHDYKSDSNPPVSHDEGNNQLSSVRTRAMSCRKSAKAYNSRNVIFMKISLFFLVFVLSNFHVSFCSKHEPVFHHNHRHSNHHRHHNHHVHHKHGEGGIRTCSHIPPKPEEVQIVHLEDHHAVRKRSVSQNLRIKLYYDESVYKLTKEQFALINDTVLPEAVTYWSKALRVRKTENRIRLSRKCEQNQVFFKTGDPHPYCKNACEAHTMCGEVEVPEEHLEVCRVCNAFGQNCQSHESSKPAGPGIESADFVFYISAMETERCQKGMTVAYAAHCQQESALDRPIAGHANLCPSSISTKRQELDILLSTVKHEMLHALGFSVSLFAFYRDKNGQPLTERGENGKPKLNEELQTRQWSDRVIRRETRTWKVHGNKTIQKYVQVVVTPRVREEVRRHYNCNKLSGAELEDQGEEGTALTHWEKRLFENEAMTGTHTQNPIYSRITMALMEDTGWYMPNYELADDLKWGRNLGCDFALQSCMEWMESRRSKGQSIHPFCNKVKRDPLETECTDDRSSVALCNLVRHGNELPSHFQNFESIPHIPDNEVSYYGGSVALADYCPYIQEFTWRSNNVVVRGSHCMYGENNPSQDRNFALERYGTNSRCFDHTEQMWEERSCEQVRQWQHWGSGCYRYICTSGRLHIMVLNHTFTCYYPNQEIEISLMDNKWLHTGSLVCPPCEDVCEGKPPTLTSSSKKTLSGHGGVADSLPLISVKDGHGPYSNGGKFKCKPGILPPKNFVYYKDSLVCDGCKSQYRPFITFIIPSVITVILKYFASINL